MKLRLEPHHFPVLILISASVLLAVKIAVELESRQQPRLPSAQQKNAEGHDLTSALKPEFVLPPLEQSYNAVLTRPLFSPSRRPVATASDSSQPSAMQKGQFTLLGVILTKDKNIAMLRENATSKIVRVVQGSEINGMQLEKMEPDKVTLKLGDEREELVLRIQPAQKQAQVAAPANNAAVPPAAGGAEPYAAAPVPSAPAPNAAPQLPANIQQFIARRRALHGLPPR